MCKWCNRRGLLPEKYPSHADNVYQDSYMMVMNYNRNVPELMLVLSMVWIFILA